MVVKPGTWDAGGFWLRGESDDRLLRLCRRLGSESFTGDWWAHKDMEGCRGRGSGWAEETPLGSPNHTVHLSSCSGGKPP